MRFKTSANESFYFLDSKAAVWNSGRVEEGGNLGYKPRMKGGYFRSPRRPLCRPARHDVPDPQAGRSLRRALAPRGRLGRQQEINYRFNTLLHSGDDMMKFKYVIKNEAWRHGQTATFMPKPIFGDNGSGMHTHQSLWKDGEPLFYDERGYGGFRTSPAGTSVACSSMPRPCSPSPTRRSTPTTVWSRATRLRSTWSTRPATAPPASASRSRAPPRRPSASSSGSRTRRATLPAFAAQLMAGLDGIKNRIEPPEPVDKDLYELPPEEHAEIKQVPVRSRGARRARGRPRVPARGDVFTQDVIDTWIDYKRKNEIDPIRFRPHPHEFEMYFDI